MIQQIKTRDFVVKFKEIKDDIYSLEFSIDGINFDKVLPECISQKKNDPCAKYDDFRRENGWSSYIGSKYNSFCIYELDVDRYLGSRFNPDFRFNIITWHNQIIHTRYLHTAYSSERLCIEEYSDSIVIIKDYSEKTLFVNNLGDILLETDGIPDWTYENLYRPYVIEKCMPYDVVISQHFVLARIKEQWYLYNNHIEKVKVISELGQSKAKDGNNWGAEDYILIDLVDSAKGNIDKSLVFYKDGSIIYSCEGSLFDIRAYEEFPDIYYATGRFNLPVFKNNQYLFSIIASSSYNLFIEKDIFNVFYDERESNIRYGIINKKLEIIIPPILEYACIEFRSMIKYRLNGKYGIWNSSLASIIPPRYQKIQSIKSFFHAIISADDEGCREQHLVIKTNGDLAWSDSFDDFYCKFYEIQYLPERTWYHPIMDVCVVLKNKSIRFGIISKEGDFIIPPNYDYIEIVQEWERKEDHNPKAFIFAKDVEIESSFDEIVKNHDLRGIQRKGGLYGLLSLEGEVIIPALYDAITVFGDYARVRKGDKLGLYHIDGRVLLDTVYTAINFLKINNKTTMAVFNANGFVKGDISAFDRYYSFGLKGFDKLYRPAYGAIVKNAAIEGGLWGYYNLAKGIRSEAVYSEVTPFRNGKATVKVNNVYYQINEYFRRCKEIRWTEQDDEDLLIDSYDEYSAEDLDDMYRDAFEGDPEATWNID